MEHTCSQGQRFDEISQKLDSHIEAQNKHENELALFMTNTNKVMEIVNGKLLPAYRREEKAEIAKEWLKEQAKSGKFWLGVLISVAAFVGFIIAALKQALR